jgi:hypothetical protein
MVNTAIQNSTDSAKPAARKKSAPAKRKNASRKAVVSAKARNGNSKGISSKLYRQGRKAVAGVYDAANTLGSSLPSMPRNLHLRERGQSMYDMVENKPLVFGVVGLGVGMVIAALLPSMHNRNSHR